MIDCHLYGYSKTEGRTETFHMQIIFMLMRDLQIKYKRLKFITSSDDVHKYIVE